MASVVRPSPFNPFITGPLLYILVRGTPEQRQKILDVIAKLPASLQINSENLVTALKWLFTLGVINKVNSSLNRWALDHWQSPLKYLGLGGKSGDGPVAWDWPSEIAVITGGCGGIGSVVAEKLALKKLQVAIMDLAPLPEKLARYKNIHHYHCDITNPGSVQEVAKTIKNDLGSPTILFNNAGIGHTQLVLGVAPDYLRKSIDINLTSHWYTVQAFLPDMINVKKKGHIIATASMASFTQVPGMVDYCVTKAGVLSFQEGLSQELKHRYNAPWIAISSVHPYWVETPLLDDWRDQLKKIGNPIMKADYVGGEIAKAILSGKSQRVHLPYSMEFVRRKRGFPWWLQELARDLNKNAAIAKQKA